ncbi:MAG: sulfatase [Saprospiraceae bacterium]|nr:sulfatase [Saprospiraceae bacterium]
MFYRYHSKTFLILLMGFLLASCETEKENRPPNILLILSDDQAWNDYSFLGHPQIETPRLDQLASESLTFTRGYVAAPLCCPSLATIISGLYPHQHGITGNDPLFEFDRGPRYGSEWMEKRAALFQPAINQFNELPLLTKRLAPLGYRSLQTGKWWMGSWQDSHFDEGMTHGDHTKGGRHGDNGLVIGRESLDPIFDFIKKANDEGQPFFVWYAPFLPHSPHTPPKKLEDKYLAKAPTPAIAKYWAMCEWFDQTCGDLLDFLDNNDLARETLVIYVCDNGWIQEPDQPNKFAPRSKQSPYEGGIRTPIMFRWPGQIIQKMDNTNLASSIDIVPTILHACNLPSDATLPGINLMDGNAIVDRKAIFAEAYEHDIKDLEEPTRSLKYRVGVEYPWKLIVPDTTNLPEEAMSLFNILEDPTEQQNLANSKPEEVTKLVQKIDSWWIPDHLKR